MTTSTYSVTGMTCSHCVRAVTAELESLDGVTGVAVDLRPEGTSSVTVTSDSALGAESVADAIGEAGYAVVNSPARGSAVPTASGHGCCGGSGHAHAHAGHAASDPGGRSGGCGCGCGS